MNDISFPDVAVLAGPIYLAFIALEAWLIRGGKAKGAYEKRDAGASIALGAGNAISGLVFASTAWAAIYWVLLKAYQASPLDLGTAIPIIIFAFIINDLAYYWVHRFSHTIRWAWANHVVHHSSTHYNLSTALRQPWFSFLTGLFVISLPLAFLGIHPAIIAFSYSLNLFYQFFIHTETIHKFPRAVEWLMNTPSHHRVHHGRNPRYLDANYAGVFIIWDRLFGTFVPENATDPVDYGLITNLETQNPFKVAVHEYLGVWRDLTQTGISWRDRLLYLIARPGWCHDGSRQTSLEIQREWRNALRDNKVTGQTRL